MVLPIYAFGHPILRKVAEPIQESFPNLKQLIEDMFDTMHAANGVGLAAPQIGQSVRIVTIDISAYQEDMPDETVFKRTFINLEIVEESGEPWAFCEGCLSVPKINEDVSRKPTIVVEYRDPDFNHHRETFDGMWARVIQHECDHLNGKVFTDHLSPLRRAMLKGRLNEISKGQTRTTYKMTCPLEKKKR